MLMRANYIIGDGAVEQILLFLFSLFALWTYAGAIALWKKHPSGLKITGSTLLLGKWFSTIQFNFNAVGEIRKAYKRCPNQEMFAIPALRQYQVLVSHPEHIREMASCRTDILSFNAALTDRLFEKQTMYGFGFGGLDPHNNVAKRAIKRVLGTHLQELTPKIRQWVSHGVESQLQAAAVKGSICRRSSTVPRTVNLTTFVRTSVMHVNTRLLFGNELASELAFQTAAVRYSMDGAFTAELSRQLPGLIAFMVGRVAMAWSGAMRAVGTRVSDLIDQRLIAESKGLDGQYLDITQLVIKSSRTPELKTRTRLTQQMMALLFAMSHQTPLSVLWAITMLSKHREYIQLLREEIEMTEKESTDSELPLKKLRLMDSFLRESSRMNPIDSCVNRMAVKDFTFSGGAHIPAGSLLAVPQHALMRDEQIYPEPDRFNGHRFYTPENDVATSACIKHTDVKLDFPYWGAPSHACPGRWYASDLAKHFLIYILKNYDFEILNPDIAHKPWIWTTELIPRQDTMIKFWPRREDV